MLTSYLIIFTSAKISKSIFVLKCEANFNKNSLHIQNDNTFCIVIEDTREGNVKI